MSPKARPANPPDGSRAEGVMQLLHNLGWALTAIPEPSKLQGIPGHTWRAIPLPDGQHLLLIHSGAALPNLQEPFKRYEDLTPYHRHILLALREQGINTTLALIEDPLSSVHLYDLGREEILLETHGQQEIAARVRPLLTLDAVARGALYSFARKSLRQRALDLKDWSSLWTTQIGPTANCSRDGARLFLFWLILSRHAEQLGIGPDAKVPFAAFGVRGRTPDAARFLNTRFTHLHENWNILQGAPLETQKMIARAAHERGLLEECLKSFACLSRAKFSADVFADAFADEELRLIGWRHSLIEKPEEADEGPERWLAGPHPVDIDRVGLHGLLRQYDVIVNDLQLLAREHLILRERGERPGLQLDLLGSDVPTFNEEDAPRVALQQVLHVVTKTRAHAEVARLVLLARAAEWHHRLWRTNLVFPTPQVQAREPQSPKPRPLPTLNPSLN